MIPTANADQLPLFTKGDLDAVWTVEPHALASKSRNTPYAGMELPARVEHVLKAGVITVRNGMVVR